MKFRCDSLDKTAGLSRKGKAHIELMRCDIDGVSGHSRPVWKNNSFRTQCSYQINVFNCPVRSTQFEWTNI